MMKHLAPTRGDLTACRQASISTLPDWEVTTDIEQVSCTACVVAHDEACTTVQASSWALGTCSIRVEMRPPKTGELGWWVLATDPDVALDELIKESEGSLGWRAQYDYSGEPDEHGMRAVTVIVQVEGISRER